MTVRNEVTICNECGKDEETHCNCGDTKVPDGNVPEEQSMQDLVDEIQLVRMRIKAMIA